jgi:GxxExxY protein
VHTALGPGHPEKVYEEALCHELTLRQIPFTRQARVFLRYKGKEVGESCVHILVGDRVVLELKSIERFTDVHVSQALAYLAALKLRLALLINFNVAHLKQGIKRAIRDL